MKLLNSGSKIGILCPGINLKYSDDAGCNAIIGINGAVEYPIINKTQLCGIWIFQDVEVFKTSFDKINNATPFQRPLICNHFNFQAEIEREESFNVKFNWLRWPKFTWQNLQYTGVTVFCAISLALMQDPEEISIFGADMQGEGYFQEGMTNDLTRHSEKRWKDERNQMNAILDKHSNIKLIGAENAS